MVFPWYFFGITMGRPKDFCEISMIFYGFPIGLSLIFL